MIARKVSVLVALAVAISIVSPGCEPTTQPPDRTDSAGLRKRTRVGIEFTPVEADDETMRTRLLLMEPVQRDLCLTEDQVKELKALVETSLAQARESRARLSEAIPPVSSLSRRELEARCQAILNDLKSTRKKLRTTAFAILTPSQAERLEQIQLQATVPTALTRPEIVKALDISEEQLAKIRAPREDMDWKQAAACLAGCGKTSESIDDAVAGSIPDGEVLVLSSSAGHALLVLSQQTLQPEKMDFALYLPDDTGMFHLATPSVSKQNQTVISHPPFRIGWSGATAGRGYVYATASPAGRTGRTPRGRTVSRNWCRAAG